ncbi:MAG: hypothetical protein HY515_01375 [Candidatus Aenigmarchaeota archaeon]|nr:hypothetical protein [Candidatus Aenigmarchaeota archaeon]
MRSLKQNDRIDVTRDFRRRACPECGSNKLMEDPSHGRAMCAKCGHIMKEI